MHEHIVDRERSLVVVHIDIKLNGKPSIGGTGEVVLSATNFEVSGTAVSEIALQCPLVEQNVLDVEIGSAAGRGYIVVISKIFFITISLLYLLYSFYQKNLKIYRLQ